MPGISSLKISIAIFLFFFFHHWYCVHVSSITLNISFGKKVSTIMLPRILSLACNAKMNSHACSLLWHQITSSHNPISGFLLKHICLNNMLTRFAPQTWPCCFLNIILTLGMVLPLLLCHGYIETNCFFILHQVPLGWQNVIMFSICSRSKHSYIWLFPPAFLLKPMPNDAIDAFLACSDQKPTCVKKAVYQNIWLN